jgi:hypothetical protein
MGQQVSPFARPSAFDQALGKHRKAEEEAFFTFRLASKNLFR